MWVLYLSFHVLNLVSCLSRYLHDPKFYKINIMFRSCLYTPTSMLLKFVQTQNYFTKFSKSEKILFFLFQADRPTGPVDRRQSQDVHVCVRLSVDRPGRPTVSSCSRVFWVDRPGRPPEENYVFFFGRSTRPVDRSQRLFASWAGGRPARSTAKPATAQRLFPLLCNSEICFSDCFLADFFRVFQVFFRANKL